MWLLFTLKIFIFSPLFLLFITIIQIFTNICIYNIGDTGGFIRNNIIYDYDYQFDWYEILFW
ncbi:hypothetical protein, partial [Campylobacter sputorum]|uniref:hypothetical protein n=1 Tax=Campylobacter sputorum TaxID=206 RepID=UPI001D0D686C